MTILEEKYDSHKILQDIYWKLIWIKTSPDEDKKGNAARRQISSFYIIKRA